MVVLTIKYALWTQKHQVYALLTYGNMTVQQPRLRIKILLKLKYENIV